MVGSCLEAALSYAEDGLPVFPVNPANKQPLTEHGFKDATTDRDTIQEWWRRWPKANLAIPTGPVTNTVVIDFDPRHGGLESLHGLADEYGQEMLRTRTHRTPSGGLHLLYTYPDNATVRNSAGALAPGVDVRGEGGYVVSPPSSDCDGNAYRLVVSPPAATDRQPMPPVLLSRILALSERSERAAANGEGETIPEGTRNDSLFTHARSVCRTGLSEAAVLSALLTENELRCSPPLPESEVRNIARSAASWPGSGSAQGQHDKSFLTVAQLFAEPEEAQRWLVEGLLPNAGLSFLVGKPKAGKSVTIQNLGACVSRGEPFLGREVRQGAVLYLALEEKRSEVRRHFQGMGANTDDPLFFWIGAAPAAAMEWLISEADKRHPALILIDRFQLFAKLGDLNDYAAVSNALSPLIELARSNGAHLMLTHHATKQERGLGDDVLGSTALYGSVDTLLQQRRTEQYRTLHSHQRYGDDLDEQIIEMDPGTFRISPAGTRHDAEMAATAAQIVDYLQGLAGEEVNRETIEANIEGRTELKRAALKALLDDRDPHHDGRLQQHGRGVKGDPHFYSWILVPTLIREQENKKPKPADFPQLDAEYSCPQESAKSANFPSSRGQEKAAG